MAGDARQLLFWVQNIAPTENRMTTHGMPRPIHKDFILLMTLKAETIALVFESFCETCFHAMRLMAGAATHHDGFVDERFAEYVMTTQTILVCLALGRLGEDEEST